MLPINQVSSRKLQKNLSYKLTFLLAVFYHSAERLSWLEDWIQCGSWLCNFMSCMSWIKSFKFSELQFLHLWREKGWNNWFGTVLFSQSVVSDSLWPQGLQHARLPCPSLSPGICSNSCPLSWWCHPTIPSSVTPFSYCFPLSLLSGEILSWMHIEFYHSFFCIYWDDHMVFILHFVNMMYHIDWLAYINELLHPWD